MMRITKAYEWHVEGEILEREANIVEVAQDYALEMRNELEREKSALEEKKNMKLAVLRAKKN
jgi:hypothetical protein